MGGKAKAPPAPDYSQLAAASEKSAEYSYKLGREQLDWAKEQYRLDREVSDRVIGRAMQIMEDNQRAAEADRAFYTEKYRPLEMDLIRDASTYGTKERRELEVGRAQAGVAQQFDRAREAATRNLESFGIDPSSTRYAALDIGARTGQAAATAAAGNQANAQVDAVSRALRSEAINVGRGYPGQVAATYGTALQGGNQAVNAGLATTASGANTMGTATQWQGLGNQAVGTWGNILNMGYQNSLDAWKANQSSSSGWGGLAGTVLGIGAKAAMSYLEDGGPVSGGAVPAEASPTRGKAVDDVPARLNAGEFVVPKDVVAWVGEKTMHQMIEKAKKERTDLPQRSGAIPEVGMAPIQPPTFASRGAV
jgi:hypothetical protein